ncbi:hypothetical protein CEP54_001437 [Fusarium duplospermum]|uniref:Uncharacterized protein n=1 Tax=Fusarium duplospermum TaxID=1325734 RepID=A0A428R0W0_9HYPO|nr:hypothetical protein CEP54_001437 [Fusarium duplospermum]
MKTLGSQEAGLDNSSLCVSEGNVTLETTFLDNCKEDVILCPAPGEKLISLPFVARRSAPLSLTVRCMIIPTGRGTYRELELPPGPPTKKPTSR